MILHTVFLDGSNPWVSLPTDRQTIKKHWLRWERLHPQTAVAFAMCGSWYCQRGGTKNFVVYRRYYNPDFPELGYHYKTLGHALAALERLAKEVK